MKTAYIDYVSQTLPGMWVTSMDGLDCFMIATNWFESLQGMATVWLKELPGQHNISSHFLPQLNVRSGSVRELRHD